MKKRFLAVFLTLALCMGLAVPAFADDYTHSGTPYPVEGGNIYFNKETGAITSADEEVTLAQIPDEIDGIPVTAIGSAAFYGCNSLFSANIPLSVTEIGDSAFAWCTGLSYSVLISNHVARIGFWAFEGCRGLHKMTIPDSVTELLDFAFRDCTGLKSVVLSKGLTEIRTGVFEGCTGLTSIVIPEGTTTIMDVAFEGCTNLTNIYIPASVTDIYSGAFQNCPNLKHIYYGGTKEQWEAIEISNWDNSTLINGFKYYNANVANVAFTDVSVGQWYSDAAGWAVENGITNGKSETTFNPYDKCKNTEILTFLWRAAGKPLSNAQVPVEIDQYAWYADALRWAAEKGMIDSSFRVGAECTRAGAVNYIWKAFGSPSTSSMSFTDVSSSAFYAKAVSWAVANGITNGTNAAQTEFSPNQVCDRGTIVTFLHRAYVPEARLS